MRKNVLLISMVAVLVASIVPVVSHSTANNPKLVAYYLHGTNRCQTCRKIEASSHQALEDRFGPELKNGTIAWKVLNFDQPENKHFIKDYGLYASSLVLVRQDQPKRWKNLEDVWQRVGDQEKFTAYVEEETRALLKDKP